MFLRRRSVDPTHHDRRSVATCGASPSLLEELAADPADFADLARVLGLDLETVVAALVASAPATADELVVRLRERGAAAKAVPTGMTPAAFATLPTATAAANEDPLRHIRALCASVGARLATTKDQRRAPSPWGGEERRGWGRWARALGGARVHRDGDDRPADPAVPATMVTP